MENILLPKLVVTLTTVVVELLLEFLKVIVTELWKFFSNHPVKIIIPLFLGVYWKVGQTLYMTYQDLLVPKKKEIANEKALIIQIIFLINSIKNS